MIKACMSKNITAKNFKAPRRYYRVLALESSCDDSCVALLDKFSPTQPPKVIDQFKQTLNSAKVGGVIPTQAHEFHQYSIANLVKEMCIKHGIDSTSPPDLICCTRGPGMVGSLSAGLQLAKGLSVAWNKPLIGVHHMLGHILIAKLPNLGQKDLLPPQYPFLSLLCSGGHTMLVLSKSLISHEIIIDTADIAVGDSLDKCARKLGLVGNMLGKELESYINSIPEDIKDEFSSIQVETRNNPYNFQLAMPLRSPKHLKIPPKIQFSFASFLSTINDFKGTRGMENERTKQFVAFKIQEVIFNHIVNRINVAIKKHGVLNVDGDQKFTGIQDFVCSGGVAANQRLREKLFNDIQHEGQLNDLNILNFHFPDLSLCTDNAIMIGVAGIEIFENLKKKSDLSISPIRKWHMNELLEVDGWVDVDKADITEL